MRGGGRRLVHAVEVQAGRAAGQQAFAQLLTTSRPKALIEALSSPKLASFKRIQRGISAPHMSEKRISCV
jgi:hypothetical protein